MAPLVSGRAADDDFVLTISDDDNIPELEDEATESDRPTSNKKRKRGDSDKLTSVVGGKKRRKAQRQQATEEGESDDSIHEEQTWADGGEDDGALDSDFEFQIGSGDTATFEEFDGWGLGAASKPPPVTGDKKGVDVDEIIARRQKSKIAGETKAVAEGSDDEKNSAGSDEDVFHSFEDEDDETLAPEFGMAAAEEEESRGEEEVNGQSEGSVQIAQSDGESESDSEAEPVAHPDDLVSQASSRDEDEEDPAEAERRAAFFAPENNIAGSMKPISAGSGSFQSMSLSRPILKGLAAVGFSTPTPIQSKTIPVALLGKDVVGGAVTGSGKTAAFVIPILERLLYRPKKVPTTRVAILMPTRELAVQCFNVTKKLASFTDVTSALIVGGFSLREQENVLRSRPDIVIATPGRFIDHMRNSSSFAVDSIEILILDEADRMLEDGFADELNEILTTIPKSRQTMLFSATMTDSVDKLIRVGLNRPVRLMVDAKRQTVQGLVQEFVRLRPGREDKRLACLLWLCENIYTERAIVFFRQKKEAHRIRVLFGLCGLKAGELHGSMTQEQRIRSVEAFRSGSVEFLLATDLASRGLDIKGVETVINYEAPQSHEIYLHRVGRTARAGRSGRACTIAAEPDRKVVKAAVKSARAQGAKIASRVVPPSEADAWYLKIEGLDDEVKAVLEEEKEEKALNQAERDVKKGENLVEHEKEIMSRPKRTWFESEKEKSEARLKGYSELNGIPDSAAGGKSKKRKLSNKEKKKLDMRDERKDKGMWKKGKTAASNGMKAGKKSASKTKPGKKTHSRR